MKLYNFIWTYAKICKSYQGSSQGLHYDIGYSSNDFSPLGFGGVENVHCGDDGCQQGTVETQTCMPIDIPPNDPVFVSKRCLEFVRTLQVPSANGCALGMFMYANTTVVFHNTPRSMKFSSSVIQLTFCRQLHSDVLKKVYTDSICIRVCSDEHN